MAKRLSGSSGDFPQIRNRLLAALPVAEFKRLRPDLELVDLPLRKVLLAADAIITHSYFIEDGLISLVQPLSDGTAVEIGLIGHEGFVGTALLLGTNRTPAEANVQMKASAWRITAAALQDAIKKNPRLQALLLHCTSALHAQVTQTAACNSRHELGPKLARWLLSASDRTHSNELALSHKSLANARTQARRGDRRPREPQKDWAYPQHARTNKDRRSSRLGENFVRMLPHRSRRIRALTARRANANSD